MSQVSALRLLSTDAALVIPFPEEAMTGVIQLVNRTGVWPVGGLQYSECLLARDLGGCVAFCCVPVLRRVPVQ